MYEYISGFSDEIAEEVDTQFKVLNKLGIKYFEPRGIDGKNISELNNEELTELKSIFCWLTDWKDLFGRRICAAF